MAGMISCRCPWCESPGTRQGTTTKYQCGTSIGCEHQCQSEACKVIERLRFALRTVADAQGCKCDSRRGYTCGLCRVRAVASRALLARRTDQPGDCSGSANGEFDMAEKRRALVDVYYIQEGTDWVVRVKTEIEDTCICVCNGKMEAELIKAMVKASAWNMTCQSLRSIAEKRLTEFLS